VSVDGQEHSHIGPGLLVLLGIAQADEERDCVWMAEKIPGLRIFADASGKMNRSLLDVNGMLLLVSQFTLLADISKGRRPSFVSAAQPEKAKALYERLAEMFRQQGIVVATGIFGADMQVALVNNGPVTIVLDSRQA
jgi:D-tyrosyl-tRNA(Tyr) deacylase